MIKLIPLSPYHLLLYWAIIFKTVCRMLSDRCLSVFLSVCLSCLSVMLVYCGQMAGWIKMKLGMEIGLGPSHIVLDGDPAPPPKDAQQPPPPIFGFAIGALVALLWQHNTNPSYMLASIPRYDDIVRMLGGVCTHCWPVTGG